ncbi:MAG: glycoside hydrolase [Fibrobacter sp.]|nr:glycoside hydrolase [Fibrobacter sp.]
MKKAFTVLTTAVALAAVSSMAAPKYPFPQNMKHPHGNVIEYADVSMIKDHFSKWKSAWYDAGQGWIYAPEGTCSTVSEAIAYGMLIAVYMDDGSNGAKDMFDKLYGTWKTNGGNGGGMNWRVGCDGGSGSASDADFDAALALIMASKQWSQDSYLNDAKTIISWMSTNDINGTKIKPGSQWNDAFNPSYATLANFRVFAAVGGSGDWNGVATWGANEIKACQNQTTGLVPDWCDWNSHQPTKTSASVQQSEAAGFFDDAARTPWRTAWDYYWFGTASSQAFNATITKWLYTEAPVASEINSGYYVDGKAEKSVKRNFASSTFSGGLGLAASSDETEIGQKYLGTVYSYLASKTACKKADKCGEGDNPGEKYYMSTLNLLYLLLMTGNMPNFYDMTGFTAFTPDPSKAPSLSELDGQQMEMKDTTVGVSGFWHWGAYHDKYGIGTTMKPDSGTSPLVLRGGKIYAEASMQIGPEPEWTQEAADAGTLKYPSAGIAMSFLPDSKKGVDLQALGVAKLRLTIKASGPIRMAVLNGKSVEAGSEPGIYVTNSSDYKVIEYDMTPYEMGFKGLNDNNNGGLLDWVDQNSAPEGKDIIKDVRGLKFEVKQKEGGIGDVSISAIEFLDASGNVIDPVSITGMPGVRSEIAQTPTSSGSADPNSSGSDPTSSGANPNSSATDPGVGSSGTGLATVFAPARFNAYVNGLQIQISNAAVGSNYAVFSMQGKVIQTGMIKSSSELVSVKNKGAYVIRVGNEVRSIIVK